MWGCFNPSSDRVVTRLRLQNSAWVLTSPPPPPDPTYGLLNTDSAWGPRGSNSSHTPTQVTWSQSNITTTGQWLADRQILYQAIHDPHQKDRAQTMLTHAPGFTFQILAQINQSKCKHDFWLKIVWLIILGRNDRLYSSEKKCHRFDLNDSNEWTFVTSQQWARTLTGAVCTRGVKSRDLTSHNSKRIALIKRILLCHHCW